jgi:hypothetical protein
MTERALPVAARDPTIAAISCLLGRLRPFAATEMARDNSHNLTRSVSKQGLLSYPFRYVPEEIADD